MVAVVTEDDWTRTVARIPAASPASGPETDENTSSTKSDPRALMPVSSDLTPTKKRYRKPIARRALVSVSVHGGNRDESLDAPGSMSIAGIYAGRVDR
jgi:hypothetical protein